MALSKKHMLATASSFNPAKAYGAVQQPLATPEYTYTASSTSWEQCSVFILLGNTPDDASPSVELVATHTSSSGAKTVINSRVEPARGVSLPVGSAANASSFELTIDLVMVLEGIDLRLGGDKMGENIQQAVLNAVKLE